jgi:hypothetical protein
MESFQIQMNMSEVTQTSTDRDWTSPAKVETGFWITLTSPDKVDRLSWVNPD